MSTRRHLLQSALAASTMAVLGQNLWAQDRYDQAAILSTQDLGDVTLIHLSDLRGQVHPAYFRPSDTGIWTGTDIDQTASLTAESLRVRFGIGGRTPMDYALTHENFAAHARAYGPMGGIAHLATAVRAIRASQPHALLLAGGAVSGAAARGLGALTPAFSTATTAPEPRPRRSATNSETLARVFMRGGHAVGVLALPRGMRPDPERLQPKVDQMRGQGAAVIVVMSPLGVQGDSQLARDIAGINVILSAHSHIALPEAVRVGDTHILCSGGQGQFLGRVDLDIKGGTVRAVRHRLVPIFADIIRPDPAVLRAIASPPDPAPLARTGEMLYRRGTLTASWDRLLCDAMRVQTGADVAMVDGHKWGVTVLPGQDIHAADLHSVLDGGAMHVTQSKLSGRDLLALIEDAAEGVFARDPYRRHGREMARFGGVAFTVRPQGDKGRRISAARLADTQKPIDPTARYSLAKWHVGDDPAGGARMADLMRRHLARRKRIVVSPPLVRLDV